MDSPNPSERTQLITDDFEGDLTMSDGIKIHFWYYGRGSNHVSIFLHGGPGHGTSEFRNGGQARRFADRFGDLIVFDQRGAGFSRIDYGAASSINFSRYIEDLNEIRDKLAANRPTIIIGRSFGGLYATHYAGSNPNNIIGYILVSPGSYNYPEADKLREEFEQEHSTDDYIALRREAAKLVKKYSDPDSIQKNQSDRDKLQSQNPSEDEFDLGTEFEKNDNIFEKDDRELLFAHSNSPTLVIYGLIDNMVTPNMIDQMRQFLPNAKFISLPGSHFAAYEYESDYFEIIEEFYKEIGIKL